MNSPPPGLLLNVAQVVADIITVNAAKEVSFRDWAHGKCSLLINGNMGVLCFQLAEEMYSSE